MLQEDVSIWTWFDDVSLKASKLGTPVDNSMFRKNLKEKLEKASNVMKKF
jgi:hypothetical protein